MISIPVLNNFSWEGSISLFFIFTALFMCNWGPINCAFLQCKCDEIRHMYTLVKRSRPSRLSMHPSPLPASWSSFGLPLTPSGQPQCIFCYYRSLLQNFINKFWVTQLFYQMSPVRNPNPSGHREQDPHSVSLLGACRQVQGNEMPEETCSRLLEKITCSSEETICPFLPQGISMWAWDAWTSGNRLAFLRGVNPKTTPWREQNRKWEEPVSSRRLLSRKIARPWNFLLLKMTNPLIALAILS